jgi:hypothetical protein
MPLCSGRCPERRGWVAERSRRPWNSRLKGLASNRFSGERFTRWSSVNRASSFPFPSRTVEWLIYRSTVHRALKVRAASTSLPTLFPSPTGSRLSPSSSHQEPSMTWLRPVDRTSGTLTLSAGTLSCLAHHRTPLSKRCPTTTALEHTTVPMDDADRMPPLGAVKLVCG